MRNVRLEKSVYVNGAISVIVSSNGWRVMQDTKIFKMDATMAVLPVGAGTTIVRAIKNNDTEDVLYAVEFSAGGATTLTDTEEHTLSAGDVVSLHIPEVAATSGGQDLLVQFLFHPVAR
jgi:hypothetical protein